MSFNSLTAKIGGALLGLALAVLSASQSAAQTTLTSLDGKVNLTG